MDFRKVESKSEWVSSIQEFKENKLISQFMETEKEIDQRILDIILKSLKCRNGEVFLTTEENKCFFGLLVAGINNGMILMEIIMKKFKLEVRIDSYCEFINTSVFKLNFEFRSKKKKGVEVYKTLKKYLNRTEYVRESQHICTLCKTKGKFQRCNQCHLAYYCSRECQVKDWKRHKKVCLIT